MEQLNLRRLLGRRRFLIGKTRANELSGLLGLSELKSGDDLAYFL